MFPEETLVARLQSGQLDAGFFYTAEAVPAKIPTVPLTGDGPEGHLHDLDPRRARRTRRAPRRSSPTCSARPCQAVLKQDGFDLISPPKVTGTGVPATVQSAIG